MGKLDAKNMKHWQPYQYGCVSGKAPWEHVVRSVRNWEQQSDCCGPGAAPGNITYSVLW